ncbi:MAG: FAD:protein FMN transferase, partial [Pirellulales bacterium]
MAHRNLFCISIPWLVAAFISSTLPVAYAQESSDSSNRQQLWQGPTMGTRYQVKIISPAAVAISQDELGQEIDDTLREVNRQMSTYLSDSEISQFNRAEPEQWFAVSPATALVVQQALSISRRSEGAYDITVGPLVQLWNFGPTDKKGPSPPPPPPPPPPPTTRSI